MRKDINFYELGKIDFLLDYPPGNSLFRLKEVNFENEILYYEGYYTYFLKKMS